MAELSMYEVQYPSGTTRQKLSEDDAKVFGDRAKRVGEVKKLSPVEVSRPGYADDSSNVESVPPKAPEADRPAGEPVRPEVDEKRAADPKNKARAATPSK